MSSNIFEWLGQEQPTEFKMKLTKIEREAIKGLRVGKDNEVVSNYYSGVEVELCPEAVAIYDLVKGCERSLHSDPNNEDLLNLFYTSRDIFIANWPKEYYLLLD